MKKKNTGVKEVIQGHRAKADRCSETSSGEVRASVNETSSSTVHNGIAKFRVVQVRSNINAQRGRGETVFYECQASAGAVLCD